MAKYKQTILECMSLLTRSLKQTFRLSPQEKSNKPLHVSRKIFPVIAIAIVAVLLVASFSLFPKTQTVVDPSSVSTPTATPTASPSVTPTPTSTKSPQSTSATQQQQGTQRSPHTIPWNPDPPTAQPKPPGIVETANAMTTQIWNAVATTSWGYFQPGIGVDSTTGLPGAVDGYPFFTDWDLGVYVQAVLDAQKLGLITRDGTWGADYRIGKVLTFLETREINNASYPYWFYKSDGTVAYEQSSKATTPVDAVDSGRLFVALNNVKNYNPTFASRIDGIVLLGRSDYAALVPTIKAECVTSTSIYAYYVYSGFAAFWPELTESVGKILDNLLNADTITTNGVKLPKGSISSDPLYCSMFELKSNPKLTEIARRVYNAHEAYYNATGGQVVGFSEGNAYGTFIYEWVVYPAADGTFETWTVRYQDGTVCPINPMIFTKISYSFAALYNTTFSLKSVIYLEKALDNPVRGYSEGADYMAGVEGAYIVPGVGSNTNGLILSAARYALKG